MTVLSIEEKFGKWKSSLSAKEIAQKTTSFGDVHVDCGKIYWTESRPWEKGVSFIVSQRLLGEAMQSPLNPCTNREEGAIQRLNENSFIDETTNIYNVTASVHGYGGGAFIAKDNILYFTDAFTNQIFKKDILKNLITQITNTEGFNFADFSIDSAHKMLYCLRLNKNSNAQFPSTEIVRIEIDSGLQDVLFSGADFYSNVRINEEGTKLLFLQWNYPNMPWDENELWCAEIDCNYKVTNPKKIFHKQSVALYQPIWMGDKIYSALNENNYWEICEVRETEVISLFNYSADFGRPLWLAGTQSFSFISDHEILANCIDQGIWKTYILDIKNNTHHFVDNKLTCIQNMAADKNSVVYIAGHERRTLDIVISESHSLSYSHNEYRNNESTNGYDISTPQLIEFTSNNNVVYAFYYPPKNNLYHAPKNEKPPCIIKIHGGPTSCADFILNPKIQYYTNRGFAYVELNYSGSSGYGKEYRARLNKKWGLVDANDCIACAEYLISTGLADRNKLILTGSSAGGFTLLNVLTRSQLFKCASCHYGVADLVDMANHIHKFEACYDQNLIGDTLQNNPNLYKERSPIYNAQNIKTPTIFFHGDKDPVVHMNQTILIANALKKQNIFHDVTIFEGEGHGFKKVETIICVLEKELNFFNNII